MIFERELLSRAKRIRQDTLSEAKQFVAKKGSFWSTSYFVRELRSKVGY